MHSCVQGVTLSRGMDLQGDVKGQLGCPGAPPALGVPYMLCPARASSVEQILPDLGQEAVFQRLQMCWHSLNHLSPFVSAMLPDREACGITCGVCGITCGVCGITCVP